MFSPNQSMINSFSPLRKTPEATLYLFSPRIIRDHYKRPLIYNFTPGYCEGLYRTIYDGTTPSSPSNPSGDYNPNINGFTRSTDALLSVLPATSGGIDIKTGVLSNNWTFMLVVSNDEHQYSNMYHSSVSNRVIYTGVIYDEPINPNNHMGEIRVNEGAYLIVTHKTIINALPIVNPYGSSTRLDTISDVDVIPTQNISQMTNEGLFMNRPSDIRDMTSQDVEDGTLVTTPSEASVLYNRSSHIPVSGKLNVPTKHSNHIVRAICNGYESVADAMFVGTLDDYSSWNEEGTMSATNVTPIIDSNLADNTNETLIGLPVDKPLNLGILMRKYQPEIVRINVPQHTQFNPRPQYYQCPQNVFSSLISSVLPTMLANTGLADFGMNYSSYNGAYQILSMAGFIPMSNDELQSRVKALIRLLQVDIFDVIRAAVGEFDLQLSSSISSDTHVILNLRDSDMSTNDIYEHNNVLGGFGSQLIGNHDVILNNSIQLGNVYQSLNQPMNQLL